MDRGRNSKSNSSAATAIATKGAAGEESQRAAGGPRPRRPQKSRPTSAGRAAGDTRCAAFALKVQPEEFELSLEGACLEQS
jgi:hypothetical protein